MSSSTKDSHLRNSHWGIVLNTTSMGPTRTHSQLRYDAPSMVPSMPHSSSQSSRRHSSKSSDKKKSYSRPPSNNKPFKCHVCERSFERNGHLKTHVVAVHEQRQPYTCDYPGCGQSFGHRSSLSRHKKGIHKME